MVPRRASRATQSAEELFQRQCGFGVWGCDKWGRLAGLGDCCEEVFETSGADEAAGGVENQGALQTHSRARPGVSPVHESVLPFTFLELSNPHYSGRKALQHPNIENPRLNQLRRSDSSSKLVA